MPFIHGTPSQARCQIREVEKHISTPGSAGPVISGNEAEACRTVEPPGCVFDQLLQKPSASVNWTTFGANSMVLLLLMCRLHYTILHRPCQALNFLQQTPISAINFIFLPGNNRYFWPLAAGQTATVEDGVTPFPTKRRRMVPVVHPSVPLGMIMGVSIVGLSKNPWFISWVFSHEKWWELGKPPFFSLRKPPYIHTHCCIWNMCTKGMPLTEEKLCFKCVSLVLHVFPGEIEPHRQLQSLSVSSKSLFSCSETFLKSTTRKTHIFSGLVTKFHCWPTTRRWMGWNDPASLVSQVSPAGFREARSCCPFPPEGHKPLQLATSYLWLSIYFKSIHSCIFVWF